MSVKLLPEHHLEFLKLKGGCTGLSKSTPVKMPHCWKSHVMGQMLMMVTFKLLADIFPFFQQSFEHVDKWLRALDKYTDCLCKVLVANKADLHPKVSMLVS